MPRTLAASGGAQARSSPRTAPRSIVTVSWVATPSSTPAAYRQRTSKANRSAASRSDNPSRRCSTITTASSCGGTDRRPVGWNRSANSSAGNSRARSRARNRYTDRSGRAASHQRAPAVGRSGRRSGRPSVMGGPPGGGEANLPSLAARPAKDKSVTEQQSPSAVALDREHHSTGLCGMLRRVVDPVPRAAVLGDERNAGGHQLIPDVTFKRVELWLGDREASRIGPLALRIRQVATQHFRALAAAFAGVHVAYGERAHRCHPVPRSGDGHVESALATLVVQRSEPIQETAFGVLAVADRKDDRVALVALHPFQVLDEE